MLLPKPSLFWIAGPALLMLAVICAAAQANQLDTPNKPDVTPERSLATRLIAAKTDDERDALIAGEPAIDKSLLAKEALEQGDPQSGQISRTEAERIARIALRVAESAGDKREIARSWYAIGVVR